MGLLSKMFGGKAKLADPSTPIQAGPGTINLLKERVDLVKKICLDKSFAVEKARVALVLDYSGSMHHLYASGVVQKLVERLLPLGVQFDDNDAIDVFLFHNDAWEVGEVSPNDFVDCVNRFTKGANFGGTNYGKAIELVTEKYVNEPGDPAYVMFITDGETSNKNYCTNMIKEAANHGIFWQFIGIGNARFDYLEHLDEMEGRLVDNAGFFAVQNLDGISDESLYSLMLQEYPQYLQEAKSRDII